MASLRAASRASRIDAIFVAIVITVGIAVGFIGTDRRKLALALIAATLMAGLMAVRPVLTAVVAVPAVFAFQDVGVGGGLGITDALLVVAALLALPALAHSPEIARLGTVNRAFLAYVLLLTPSLVANQTGAADREVFHRLVLVLGAMLVGCWVVKEQMESLALRLLLITACALAVACILNAAQSGFSPAEPFGYNKNFVGSLLALTLLVTLCAPDHLGVGTTLRVASVILLIAGTLTSQSRGAVLGAAAGGLIWLFAPRRGTDISGRNRLFAVLLAGSFLAYSGYSVEQQFTSSERRTNSAGVRLHVEAFTRDLWRSSPLVGVGLRYYRTHDYGPDGAAPNNAFDAELAEGGLVGTTGFTLFHIVVIVALWRRRRSQLGIAALALVVGQFLHGQFDIYWSSGVSPLPFILTGMSLASSKGLSRGHFDVPAVPVNG